MEFHKEVGRGGERTEEGLNSDTSGEDVEVVVDCYDRIRRLRGDDELGVEGKEVTLKRGKLEGAEVVNASVGYFRLDSVE